MLIARMTRDELIILGIIFTVIKVLLIVWGAFLFGGLFLVNWGEARWGRSIFSFAFCFGTLLYLLIIGTIAIARGHYRPSLFLSLVLFLLATAWAFNRVEIVNPLLDALLLAAPLTFIGAALVGGLHSLYTSGSFFGHFANWGLTCAAITIVGAVRNYIYGR